jgi:hypothetical protein
VVLYDSNMAQPSFTAPQVDPIGATLEFELTVSDGLATVTDSVTVLVNNNNVTPTADAGADQTVDEGTPATLDGSASSDPDDDPLTYIWSQTSGPLVNLSDANSAMPSFTAPVVGPGGATLAFQLTVNDGIVDSAPDEVTIYVLDTNDPPMCSAAQPSMAILWPPNHKLVAVQILGVTDPDNDGVTIIVTGVTQDEPIIGLGDGDTGPDAVITSDGILLRAERSGTGDGRVYVIAFTASDIDGGSCSGIVTVGVPHDRAGTPVDSGQNYDSLQS